MAQGEGTIGRGGQTGDWSERSTEFEAGEGEGKVQDTAVGSWQRSTRNCQLSQPAFPRLGSIGH